MHTLNPQRRGAALAAMAVTAALLAGCKGDVLDYRNVQVVDGKVYAGDANEPFSGKLTNVPSAVILSPQQGFKTAMRTMEKTLPALTLEYISAAGIDYFPTDARIAFAAYCDAHVSNDYLDGKAICKAANSDKTLITTTFRSGQLDGELDSYAPDDTSHLFAKITFRDGNADGRMEVYSPSTHRLVHTLTWANGALNGDEEGFDENTGNRVLQASLVNGQYEGKMTGYAPDGNRVIYSASYTSGLKQGVEEAFDPETGKPAAHAEYVDGKLNGTVKRWNADGKLIYERDYRNGLEIPDSEAVIACLDQKYEAFAKTNSDGENVDAALHNEWEATCKEEPHSANSTVVPAASAIAPSHDADACVSNWTAAYRRENGADALVTDDQLGEWKSWCKAGKQPS